MSSGITLKSPPISVGTSSCFHLIICWISRSIQANLYANSWQAKLGQSATRAGQNSRGRAPASGDRSGRWNESQDQMCYVGFVFPRSSVGVLWPQSHLFRHTGGNWGHARSEHGSSNQREVSEIPIGFVTRTAQVRAGGTRVSGSASRFSGRSFGNSPRGIWSAPLAGVQLREHELQRSALVLLTPRWEPEEHKNGSVCKAVADASKPETILAGVEVTKPLQQPGRLRFSIRKTARQQAAGFSFSVKEEDSACIQTNRNHGVLAGTLFGTRLEPCWPRWANISSPSATTCGTATSTSRTNTCRQRQRQNGWHRTSWSTPSCRQVFRRRQT